MPPLPSVLRVARMVAPLSLLVAGAARGQAAPAWPLPGSNCPAPAVPPAGLDRYPAVLRASMDTTAKQYRKVEACIPMRDGVRLYTAIYIPRDTTQAYPFLMERTPYSAAPYGTDLVEPVPGPNRHFADEGFIFVTQDVRGRYMSEGYYQYMTPNRGPKRSAGDIDESTDTYDTVEWLLRNVPHNNGRVGIWGISAPGMLTTASMIDAHPALVAASPQAPMIDWYMGDDRHKHGAFTLAQTFNFLQGFARTRPGPTTAYSDYVPQGRVNPDGYRFFLEGGSVRQISDRYLQGSAPFFDSILVHPNYDAFWQQRSLGPQLRNITPAVLIVGGWFDGEDQFGPFEAWRQLDALSPNTERYLAVGPWWHGQWNNNDGSAFGLLQFGQKTGQFYRDSLEFPFFNCKLKGRCDVQLPKVSVFSTGSNQWKRYDRWPPREAATRVFYLGANGSLSEARPAAGAFDEYVSDPAKPVPYTAATSFGYWRFYPSEDQRFVAGRPDVLVYETEPLGEDLTIAGQVAVTLHVSSTGTDADFIAKVIDVYPDDAADPPNLPLGVRYAGMQQLVRGDVMRARWRRGYTRPSPLVANRPDSVAFTMNDVFHTFRKGHRMMVQVQSTWFPLIDRNPQTFVPSIYEAKPRDFRKATMRIFRSAARPSRIEVRVADLTK